MIDRLSPAQRPEGRAAGFQRWRNLLFLHWPIATEALAAKLPPRVEVDTFDGQAWVGLVAFTMRDVAPWWAPVVPGVSHFHELNLRTYVVVDGRPGVWFFSLEAAGSIAVVIARNFWKLPYHRATMTMDIDGPAVRYRSDRRWPGPTPARFAADYTIGEPVAAPEPGSFEHFLVERYLLFTTRGDTLLEGQVHHVPYPLRDVTIGPVEESIVAAAGLPPTSGTPLAHYSDGVDVDVFDLHPV